MTATIRTGASQPHHTCRACLGGLERVLNMGMQPLANNLCDPVKLQHNDAMYPLRLVRCSKCSLLQLDTVIDPSAMFSHYLYTPSQSKKTLAHFEELARGLTENTIRRNAGTLAVDIGSNDGALLGFLKARGWRVAGVDPAANLVEKANAAGLPTVHGFFGDAAVDTILAEHGPARLITACNVFAHTPNWKEFVRCASRLLLPTGVLVLEFPYGPVMLRDGTFDLIYFEHASFPALGPLHSLVTALGMSLLDAQLLPAIHGGSIRVWITKDAKGSPFSTLQRLLHEEETRSYTTDACERFAFRAMLAREKFVDAVREEKRRGRRVIGYTAPAKAVTLLEFCRLGAADIDCIVDDNPLKQGKLLPGSHIPVLKDAQICSDDTVIIFAWNVAEDIMSKLPLGVDVIVPMPEVRTIRRPLQTGSRNFVPNVP